MMTQENGGLLPDPIRQGIVIVILNYNSGEDLRQCLGKVLACGFDVRQVIVVDNASADASLTWARAAYPDAHYHQTGANGGYCQGNNAGIRIARSCGFKHALILNPDSEIQPASVGPLFDLLRANPRMPLLVPTLLRPGDDRSIGFHGTFHGTMDVAGRGFHRWFLKNFLFWGAPVPRTQASQAHPHKLQPVYRFIDSLFWGSPVIRTEASQTRPDELREIHCFIGCAVLVNLAEIPWEDLFDGEIFINGAEAELMLRCVTVGLPVFHSPRFVVLHEGGVTHAKSDRNRIEHTASVIYSSRRHHSRALHLLFLAYFVTHSGLGALRDIYREKRLTVVPRIRGVLTGLRKRIPPSAQIGRPVR